jgi:hypothetical protein
LVYKGGARRKRRRETHKFLQFHKYSLIPGLSTNY